jgi:hypothetical protein
MTDQINETVEKSDKNCGSSATADIRYPATGTIDASVKVVASGTGTVTKTTYKCPTCWNIQVGRGGYRPPSSPPSDSIGLSNGQISEQTDIDSISHSVRLSNFSGNMTVSSNTNHGITILYVVWIPKDSLDEIINTSEVLWKGKARFEFGSFITDGFLNSSDFTISNVIDSATGILCKRAVPISGLVKNLSISNAINLDHVTVSTFLEGGYGTFYETDFINSDLNIDINEPFEGFLNAPTNRLNIRDTVTAYLRTYTSPYYKVDSAKAVIDSITFTGNFAFKNAATGNYYIQTKHRNSLETWSKAGGVNLVKGSTNSYNFSTAITQAYGNNLKLNGTQWCTYSGDVDQNGSIDLTDILQIYNAASIFTTGYAVTDLTGDGITDLNDILIAYNNAVNFVSVQRP